MEIKQIKAVKPNRHLFRKVFTLLFSVAVIIVSFVIITKSNEAAKDTVEILRIKAEDGLPPYSVLTEANIEKYAIIRKEFNEEMIDFSEKDRILNKYSKYFIREGSILYEDQFTDEKPLKDEWLYGLEEEMEVLTLPYNYLECGGDILMPGDRVRIRVSYEAEVEAAATGNPNQVYSDNKSEKKVEVLFDSIVVKDMLNSNSHSIYEVYKEVMKLSEDKKAAVMKSEEFLKSIQPRALLLEGTSEQVNTYAKYKNLDSNALLITILSRKGSNVILDQLPTLEKEVESWIEKKTND